MAITVAFASCVQNDPYVEPEESDLKGQLFFNEVNGTGGASQSDAEKYVELYNKSDENISLKDFTFDYGGTETWKGRAEDIVPAKGYKVIKGTKTTYPGMSTGLSCRNANVNLTLLDPNGGIIDYYEKIEDLNGKPLEQMNHMRIPDGGPKWYYVEISAQSPGESNLSSPSHSAVKGEMPAMEKVLRIEEVGVSATKPVPDDDVIIVARITDVNVITSVVLKWKKGGVDQPDITMAKDGSNYSATIPKQPDKTVVDWTISATNDKGKTVTATGTITWTAPAIDYTKLKLNEISGVGADAEKFYELINTGTPAINLDGCKLFYNNAPATDNSDGSLTWTGASTQVINGNALFTLLGRNTPGSFTTGLTAQRNIKITLRDPAGNLVDLFERSDDSNGIADKSYSRVPNGTGDFYYTTPSPDVLNPTSTDGLLKVNGEIVLDYRNLKLNEVSGVGEDSEKFYELINLGPIALPLEGCKIYYNANASTGGTIPIGDGNLTWTGNSTQVIQSGRLFTLLGRNTPGSFTTGLTCERILIITLKDPDGNTIDQCIRAQDTGTYATPDRNKSYSRIPDGIGPFYFTDPSLNEMNGTDAAGLLALPTKQ